MARLGNILHENLGHYHFESHPVWADDGSNDYSAPVLDFDALPDDLGTLYIAAQLETPEGLRFEGFVADSTSAVYAIGICVGDEDFIFNLNLQDEGRDDLEKLRTALGNPVARVFPLKYVTQFHHEREENIAGMFNLFEEGGSE